MTISEQGLSLSFSRRGGAVVVSPAGELDAYTAPRLRRALVDIVDEQGNMRVAVDLSAVTFIDSSALSVLVGLYRRLMERGGTFALANPSRPVLKVLEISGLLRLIPVTGNGDASVPSPGTVAASAA
jgi:anti-anti-sigma factor